MSVPSASLSEGKNRVVGVRQSGAVAYLFNDADKPDPGGAVALTRTRLKEARRSLSHLATQPSGWLFGDTPPMSKSRQKPEPDPQPEPAPEEQAPESPKREDKGARSNSLDVDAVIGLQAHVRRALELQMRQRTAAKPAAAAATAAPEGSERTRRLQVRARARAIIKTAAIAQRAAQELQRAVEEQRAQVRRAATEEDKQKQVEELLARKRKQFQVQVKRRSRNMD
eukprot:g1171.t1